MSTTAISESYYHAVDKMSNLFNLSNSPKISAIKQVILVTTNIDSKKNSEEFVNALQDMQVNLPLNEEEVVVEKLKSQLQTINNNLLEINKVLDSIKTLFDACDGDTNSDVEIDDENMLDVLANLEKAKKIMLYISDYLNIVIDVHNSKNEIESGNYKVYTAEQFIQFLKAS